MAVSGKVWCTENLRRPDVLHLTLTKPASTALECGTARPDLSAVPSKGDRGLLMRLPQALAEVLGVHGINLFP